VLGALVPQRLSRALNLRVVTYGAGGAGGLVARPFGAGSGTGRKTLAQTIAFVLSRPAPAAFYLAAPTFEGVEGGGTTWLPLVTSRAFPWATHGVLDGQVRTRAAIAAASEPKVAATPTDGTPAVKRAASRSVDDESPTALPADDGAAGLAQPRAARALEAAAAAADAAAGSSLAGAPSAKRKRSGSRKAANFVVEAIVARRVEPAAASRKGAAGAESVSYLVKWVRDTRARDARARHACATCARDAHAGSPAPGGGPLLMRRRKLRRRGRARRRGLGPRPTRGSRSRTFSTSSSSATLSSGSSAARPTRSRSSSSHLILTT
jgi:hypothetical protein